MGIETELQAQVDAQLMEQGAFAPLDLLFNSGRLFYSDYEAWRRREIEVLDEVLMGDRANIVAEIERAVSYARSIGLVEQPQEFSAWSTGGSCGPALRVSADTRLHKLVGTRYLPAQNAPQMDLFFDNPVVALTNGIARSLSARNALESQRQLDRLYVQAPNHSDLAAFDRLVRGLDDLNRPVEDPAGRLEFLLAVGPTARHLLGASGSRDYLSPLWRHLADSLSGRPYCADQPELHRSFALSQAQDWTGVSDSVIAEGEWWLHAPLCLRLAESSFRRRRRVEALTAWCYLCWLSPAEAAPGVARLRQPDLSGLWQAFNECDEEEGLGAEEFPAWLLLHEPGLARQLSVDLPRGNSASEENYRCVHRWIHAHRTHRRDEEIALRKQLQQSHPVLFAVLKRTVG